MAETKDEVVDLLRSDIYATSGVWDVDKVNPMSLRRPSPSRLERLTCSQAQIYPVCTPYSTLPGRTNIPRPSSHSDMSELAGNRVLRILSICMASHGNRRERIYYT